MNRAFFRTRIKFCGFTRAGDVRLASECGADAIGFVFAADSPRRVEPRHARALRAALAPLVDAVAVFRDNSVDEVREAIRNLRPTLLQFHGSETDAQCRSFGLPYVKALGLGDGPLEANAVMSAYPAAAGFMFDSHRQGQAGGTGKLGNWAHLPTGLTKPFMLSGGLDADTVLDAIQTILPWGVDASSGIESAPGIKDGEKMLAFVEAVRRADCVEMADNACDIKHCAACGR